MVINHMRANSHSIIIKNTQHSQQALTAVGIRKTEKPCTLDAWPLAKSVGLVW